MTVSSSGPCEGKKPSGERDGRRLNESGWVDGRLKSRQENAVTGPPAVQSIKREKRESRGEAQPWMVDVWVSRPLAASAPLWLRVDRRTSWRSTTTSRASAASSSFILDHLPVAKLWGKPDEATASSPGHLESSQDDCLIESLPPSSTSSALPALRWLPSASIHLLRALCLGARSQRKSLRTPSARPEPLRPPP